MKQSFHRGEYLPSRLTDELLAAIPELEGTHHVESIIERDDGSTEVTTTTAPNLAVWYWPPGAEIPDQYKRLGRVGPALGVSVPDSVSDKAVAAIVKAHDPTPTPTPVAALLDALADPDADLAAVKAALSAFYAPPAA